MKIPAYVVAPTKIGAFAMLCVITTVFAAEAKISDVTAWLIYLLGVAGIAVGVAHMVTDSHRESVKKSQLDRYLYKLKSEIRYSWSWIILCSFGLVSLLILFTPTDNNWIIAVMLIPLFLMFLNFIYEMEVMKKNSRALYALENGLWDEESLTRKLETMESRGEI